MDQWIYLEMLNLLDSRDPKALRAVVLESMTALEVYNFLRSEQKNN